MKSVKTLVRNFWKEFLTFLLDTPTKRYRRQCLEEVERFELAQTLKGKKVVMFRQKIMKPSHLFMQTYRHFAILLDADDDKTAITTRLVYFSAAEHEWASAIGDDLEARYNLMLKVNGKNNKIN
jgi:hypothetical protein